MRESYDAIIVGARVAGAATALQLAMAGARVLIVDAAPVITDTLSTHALMRPAVELLSRWRLLDQLVAADTPWVRHVLFQYGSDQVHIPVKPSERIEGLIAPRRWLLDRTILDAAREAGAEVALGTRFEDCRTSADGRVVAAILRRPDGGRSEIGAENIIGADGRRSRVAAKVGARIRQVSPVRSATVYGYFPGVTDKGYRWYYGDAFTAGVIPTTGGESCVFAAFAPNSYKDRLGKDAVTGLAHIVGSFDPELAEVVRSQPDVDLRRFLGAPGIMRQRVGPGWALVGDAACFRDPITAHGITDAMLDASSLTQALTTDRLPSYASIRDAQATKMFNVTQQIARLDWSMDRLKALHVELNACLKAEQSSMSEFLEPSANLLDGGTAGRSPKSVNSRAIAMSYVGGK